MAQTSTSSISTATKQTKRGPVFRATKDQINQAQAILKTRGFYGGEQIGKLDDVFFDLQSDTPTLGWATLSRPSRPRKGSRRTS